MDCSHLQGIAHSISLVQECDVIRNGALRMATPFVYPDGSNIDVFLEQRKSDLWNSYVLSDYGQTGAHLYDAQMRLDSSSRRRELVKEICSKFGVTFRDGSFEVELADEYPVDISDAVLRLSQACVRIADFVYHQRLRSQNPFRDDIEGFFEAADVSFTSDVRVPLSTHSVKIDFQTTSRSGTSSFVLLVSASTQPGIHKIATDAFAKWFDLDSADYSASYKFVSLYDSRNEIPILNADLERLAKYSTVISYPKNEEELAHILR